MIRIFVPVIWIIVISFSFCRDFWRLIHPSLSRLARGNVAGWGLFGGNFCAGSGFAQIALDFVCALA